jgi:hypothetical protein
VPHSATARDCSRLEDRLEEVKIGHFVFEIGLAEGEGFEPPVAHRHGCFQDSHITWASSLRLARVEAFRLTSRRPNLIPVIRGCTSMVRLG